MYVMSRPVPGLGVLHRLAKKYETCSFVFAGVKKKVSQIAGHVLVEGEFMSS